jgi:hypothetical protein
LSIPTISISSLTLVGVAIASFAFMEQASTDREDALRYPLSAVDREIDQLGVEGRIKSEEDARSYIAALLAKYQVDEAKVPRLNDLASRLAKAEYAAVREPRDRIHERALVATFNSLMERMGAPGWTRVSNDEFHAFRLVWSLNFYPNWVSRPPDGNLPKTCRPVEALYLVYLLYLNGGVPPKVREAISAGRLPAVDPAIATPSADSVLRVVSMTRAEFQHRQEYREARLRYLENHPDLRAEAVIQDLFNLLGIE